jgi:hypothetical protein
MYADNNDVDHSLSDLLRLEWFQDLYDMSFPALIDNLRYMWGHEAALSLIQHMAWTSLFNDLVAEAEDYSRHYQY